MVETTGVSAEGYSMGETTNPCLTGVLKAFNAVDYSICATVLT